MWKNIHANKRDENEKAIMVSFRQERKSCNKTMRNGFREGSAIRAHLGIFKETNSKRMKRNINNMGLDWDLHHKKL